MHGRSVRISEWTHRTQQLPVSVSRLIRVSGPHATLHHRPGHLLAAGAASWTGGQAHATSPPGSRGVVLSSSIPSCRRPHMPCHVGVELSSWGCPTAAACSLCLMARPHGRCPSSRSLLVLATTSTQLTRGVGEGRRLDWTREPASQFRLAVLIDSRIDECSRRRKEEPCSWTRATSPTDLHLLEHSIARLVEHCVVDRIRRQNTHV